MADVLAAEGLDRLRGSAWADEFPFAQKGGDSFFDARASFGAGDDEAVSADAQRAPACVVGIRQQELRGRDQPDFVLRTVLGKDAQTVPVDAGPELDFGHEFFRGHE